MASLPRIANVRLGLPVVQVRPMYRWHICTSTSARDEARQQMGGCLAPGSSGVCQVIV